MTTYYSIKTAFWLLWCDIFLFLKDWKSSFFNSIAWPTALIGVNAIMLPALGMPPNYGAFITVSMLISLASYTAWRAASALAFDFEENRTIYYELTLPIAYQIVYLKNIVQIGLRAALFSVNALIIGTIICFNVIDFQAISPAKFLIIYLLDCLFLASFAMWAASMAASGRNYINLELRIMGPLVFVSGYSFPWATLYALSPVVGTIMLASPWVYAYEGTRAALLGQQTPLSFWICCAMLLFFILLFGLWGMRIFRKRLDCI